MRHTRERGFTLTEVLIAIGLMGVAMTMAAAMFPAAIKENEKSYKDCVGMIISENGFAVSRSVLYASDVTSGTLDAIIDEVRDGDLAREYQHYPSGKADADLLPGRRMRGFILLGREDGPDAHQLVSVSYVRDAGNTVAAAKLNNVNIEDANDPDMSILSGFNGNEDRFMKVGGWVIVANDKEAGEYARIVRGSPGEDWYVTPRPFDTTTAKTRDLWTVVEILGDNPGTTQGSWTTKLSDRSPILAIMVTRTALRD